MAPANSTLRNSRFQVMQESKLLTRRGATKRWSHRVNAGPPPRSDGRQAYARAIQFPRPPEPAAPITAVVRVLSVTFSPCQ